MANNYLPALRPEIVADLQERLVNEQPLPVEEPSTTRNVRRRLGADGIAELVRRYEAGESTTALMKGLGLSKTSMLRVLRDEGVGLRRQGMNEQQIEEAVKLYEAGDSVAVVARKIDARKTTVQTALRNAGVPLRSRPGWSNA